MNNQLYCLLGILVFILGLFLVQFSSILSIIVVIIGLVLCEKGSKGLDG